MGENKPQEQGGLEPNPDPERRWRNRRRMAWLSLAAQIAYPLLVVWGDAQALEAVTWPFYLATGSIVGLYIGSAVWETVRIGPGR